MRLHRSFNRADAMNFQDAVLDRLTSTQRAAWRHVVAAVDSRRVDARTRLTNLLRSAGCTQPMFDAAIESVRHHARVVVHFHPDRIGVKPMMVAEALLEEGQYRSQFETGLSSGGTTAYPGGPRDDWERSLFGGAYHSGGSSLGERPKYGALELIRYPDGPWPRFGSCYLVLRREVARRTSFTFSGSEQPDAPERLGTIDCMEGVLAPLLAEVKSGEGARGPWPPFAAPTLGVEHLTISGLLERLSHDLPLSRQDPSIGKAGRVLDSGIEAQVHGPIDLREDVERLVADPAFRGTPIGDCLSELCRTYAIALDWHCGFRLAARDVPEDFRGPAVARLAQRIADDGHVDAAVIGAAQRSLRLRPHEWQDWGSPDETLQHLKQLWHVLVHCGAPAAPSGAAV
jgi:hypothetical protein